MRTGRRSKSTLAGEWRLLQQEQQEVEQQQQMHLVDQLYPQAQDGENRGE